MKNIYGFILLAGLAAFMFANGHADFLTLAVLLAILLIYIIKIRFCDNIAAYFVFFAVALILSCLNGCYAVLFCIPTFDFACSRRYVPACAAAAAAVTLSYFSGFNAMIIVDSAVLASGFFGYLTGSGASEQNKYISALDDERRLRYELEKTKNELLSSRAEIERLTEDRERNRIAHELHDNVGHSIAGVIFQLEAAERIFIKDSGKVLQIIRLCSKKLSETLDVMRSTVYNMKPESGSGIDCINRLIEDYGFCHVDFTHSGDFNVISATNLRIIEADIKEALTNASKYSGASIMHISINIGKKHIRLCMEDDGRGCENIKDGLGLGGMRERSAAVGGTLAADGSSGFRIICTLPVEQADNQQEV